MIRMEFTLIATDVSGHTACSLGGSLWGIGASIGAGIDPEPARQRNRRGRPIIGEEQPGMSLFQRAHAIVQAKANKALDAAEKPDEMLDLSYEQMLDQITQVRRGLGDRSEERRVGEEGRSRWAPDH